MFWMETVMSPIAIFFICEEEVIAGMQKIGIPIGMGLPILHKAALPVIMFMGQHNSQWLETGSWSIGNQVLRLSTAKTLCLRQQIQL